MKPRISRFDGWWRLDCHDGELDLFSDFRELREAWVRSEALRGIFTPYPRAYFSTAGNPRDWSSAGEVMEFASHEEAVAAMELMAAPGPESVN